MTNETVTETKPVKTIIYYANKDIIPEPTPGHTWRYNDVSGWKNIKNTT